MRNILIRIFKVALGILGVAAVDSCDIFVTKCEYGSPHADFQAKGIVKDENNKGIEGIRVVLKGEYPNSNYSGAGPMTDTLWTDKNGSYVTESGRITDDFAYLASIKMEFEDVDGPENGGEFQKVEIEVPVFKVKDGDGNWYQGAYEAGADITMNKK